MWENWHSWRSPRISCAMLRAIRARSRLREPAPRFSPAVAERRIQSGNRGADASRTGSALRFARVHAISQNIQRPGGERVLRVLGNRDTVRNNHLNLLSSRQECGAHARTRARRTRDPGRTWAPRTTGLSALKAPGTMRCAPTSRRSTPSNCCNWDPGGHAPLLDDRGTARAGNPRPEIIADDAAEIGLAARLDYLNAKDRLRDSHRKVEARRRFSESHSPISFPPSGSEQPAAERRFSVPDIDPLQLERRTQCGLDPFDRTRSAMRIGAS